MNQTIHLTHNDPTAQPAIRLMLSAFPSYNGRKFKVRTQNTVNVRSCWDGGSRDTFRFVELATGACSDQVPAQSAFDRPIQGADSVTLPDGAGCVEHSIFCGKDMGLTLIIPPEAAPKLLPPKDDATDDELIVLKYTRSLKNTYSGQTNIRFTEASRDGGITQERWTAAQDTLKARKLLNKSGAITPAGRNAVPGY
jgi:hypothetical protein